VKSVWNSRALFATYELIAACIIAAYVFTAAAFLIGLADGFDRRSGILLALAVLAGFVGSLVIRCPKCGKSPMRIDLTSRTDVLGDLLSIRRIWPERECSRCRAPLDIL
jgi:hypothetical protein